MENLYFLVYNNSYNQTFRRENSLADYLPYQVGQTIGTYLWNENDGVSASVTLNYEPTVPHNEPDYCVVTDEDGIILSRWFVTEMKRTRQGQYFVSLDRDVVADSAEILPLLKVKARRGLLPQTSSLILQKEDINVNQIKVKETLIKDNTGIPWIVGYVSQKSDATFKKVSGLTAAIKPNQTVAGIENFTYWANTSYGDHTATPYKGIPNRYDVEFRFIWSQYFGINNVKRTRFEVSVPERAFATNLGTFQSVTGYYAGPNGTAATPSTETIRTAFKDSTQWYSEIIAPYEFPTENELSDFTKLDGQIILDTNTNKYYKATVKRTRTVETLNFDSDGVKAKFPNTDTILHDVVGASSNAPIGTEIFNTVAAYFTYTIELTDYKETPVWSYDLSTTRAHTLDAPYDLICIPYGKFNGVGSEQIAMDIATQTIAQNVVGANGVIYDFQLLPYCPLQNLNINDLTEGTDYTKVKDSAGATIAYIYYCNRSSFKTSFLLSEPVTVADKKIDYLCNSYRFVSPNYSSQFEISAAANDYGFSMINVSCTYMPFNPYIKVAPDFSGLYGKDFGDARGLICGGDFSLPIVNDAWVQYQQSNKNYAAIFDRNIDSLEFTNSIQRRNDIIQAIVGTISGLGTGLSGFLVSKGIGATMTGLGAIGAGYGGYEDVRTNQALRDEQMSLTKDLHRLNLQNIQAQPMSLSRTTAFNADNKIFPILETYSCSVAERKAVVDSLINRSFTIGAIMNLGDLLNTIWYAPEADGSIKARNWIEATVIEFPREFGKDTDFLVTLANRLAQGYYFEYWEET